MTVENSLGSTLRFAGVPPADRKRSGRDARVPLAERNQPK